MRRREDGRKTQELQILAQLSLIKSSGGIITCFLSPVRPFPNFEIKMSIAISAILAAGWETVVKDGDKWAASSMSS